MTLRSHAWSLLGILLLAASGEATPLDAAEGPASSPPGGSPSAAQASEARRLIQAGNYREAESAARRRLAEVEAESGPRALATAQALDELAEALWNLYKGADPEVMKIAVRALEIKEAILDESDPELVPSLRNLAIMTNQTGDYPRALPFFERAVRISESAMGSDHPLVAQSLENLAHSLRLNGDYAGARALGERSLAIKRRIGDSPESIGKTLNNLAGNAAQMGDIQGARRLFEEALALYEKALPADHPVRVMTIDNLAEILLSAGEVEPARPLAENALRLREAKLGPDHPQVAFSLLRMGHLEVLSGNGPAALAYLDRAIALREKQFGPNHPLVALALTSRGEARDMLGDPAGARADDERALRIQDQTIDPRHPSRAQTLLGLSRVLLKLGETSAAFETGLQAARSGGDHFRATAQGLSQSEALRYALERNGELNVALSILAGPGAERSGPGGVARVWDQVVRSRALVLDEMASRHRYVSGQEGGEVTRRAQALNAARGRLAGLLGKVPPSGGLDAYREQVTRAYAEKEEAERLLAEASAPFRRQQVRSRAGFEDVVRHLPQDSALLAFVQYQQRPRGTGTPIPSYAAFVVRSGRKEPAFLALGRAGEIDALVEAWQRETGTDPRREGAASASGDRYRDAGERLRRRIWDPVASRLGRAGMILIVPDGALNLVNIATLPLPGGRFLLEDRPILHLLSSERDLVPVGDAPGKRSNVLAIGGVDYEAAPTSKVPLTSSRVADAPADAVVRYRGPDPACEGLGELRFTPLPATGAEIAAVAAGAARKGAEPAVRTLTGASASESTFKSEADRYGTLHLATHAWFVEDRCTPAPGALPDPLLWSGLALAGANRRGAPGAGGPGEDGLLTADEIATLDLSGVGWAVLSACQTGVGPVRHGEGVLGLRRAFAIAGAGTLVMSLWKVEDEATSAWMEALYRARSRPLSTAASVRQAGLDLLAAQRKAGRPTHPFYWGGFIAAGDWR